MKKFSFSDSPTSGAVAHEEAFGDIEPDDLPWQLCWPSAYPEESKSDGTCVEYGAFLAECVKRGKPVTVREYVDFFWKGEDGVYRGGITKEVETRDYGEFVRLVSADDADL